MSKTVSDHLCITETCVRIGKGELNSSVENSDWLALHLRRRFERSVSSHLLKRDIEHYLPWRRVTRQMGNGIRSIEVPLLLGYVFCKAHPVLHRSLLTIPGVLDFAGGGWTNFAISEQKVNDLKRIVEAELAVRPWPFTPTGKKVTIQIGALKGVSGILNDTSSNRVLIVSIVPIRRSIAIEVDHRCTFSAGTGG